MNLSQIEVIVEIAKAGSISQAAQNLFISQPGVSKMLQRFEEEAGKPIFDRTSTGVRLTPLGRKFVDSAQDILDQVVMLRELFKSNIGAVFMELNIASMSYHFMHQMIPELYNKYKQNSINIRYTECSFEDELDMIERGHAEIGVVSFWHQDLRRIIKRAQGRGVDYHRLGPAIPYIAVSADSKKYPVHIQELDLKRLASMPIISISPSSPMLMSGWDFMRQLFGRDRMESSGKEITTSSTGTMKEIVTLTDGFSLVLLNPGIHQRYGFFKEIRLIRIPDSNIQFEMGWLQRTNTVRSPLANEFISLLSSYIVH